MNLKKIGKGIYE